jgi:hypothetical protein
MSARRGLTPTDKAGWLYVVTNPAWRGLSKAGMARNVERRLVSYQTGSPHRDYSMEGAVWFPDRALAERALFRRCRGYRLGSTEWFSLHPTVLLGFITKLKEEIAPNGQHTDGRMGRTAPSEVRDRTTGGHE